MNKQESETIINHVPKEPFKNHNIGRRLILKAGIVGSVALAIGVGEEIADELSQEELYPQLTDIKEYRASLGLSPVPRELVGRLDSVDIDWEYEPRFANTLPDSIRSYGMLNKSIQDVSFGENAERLVTEVGIDSKSPYSTTFSDFPKERKCNIPVSIYNTSLTSYAETVMHESIGHGSDPNKRHDLYPTRILLPMVHGKWRMLSQAFLVEGQFFNHPKDLMLPNLKKKLGEEFAFKFRNGEEMPMFSNKKQSQRAIEECGRIASEHGVALSDLKFNKRRCLEVGERIFEMVTKEGATFGGDTKDWYESLVEDALVEIYAEMMRMAVMHPDQIGFNEEIIGGCTEILSSISEKDVDPEKVRYSAIFVDPEILERHNLEQEFIKEAEKFAKNKSYTPTVAVSSNPIYINIRNEQSNVVRDEDDFGNFVERGILPNNPEISPKLYYLCEQYGYYRGNVEVKYKPRKIVHQGFDYSFDPNLDIWDIRKIESALSNGFVRTLLSDLKTNPAKIDAGYLSAMTTVLYEFFTSDAFGT